MSIFNTYDLKIARPDIFQQLSVKDMLFVYYICPQVEKVIKLFTHFNEIAFTLSGKKTLHHKGKSWTLTENSSLFIRKTAYSQEMYVAQGWEVLAFYFQDDFLRQVFNAYKAWLPIKNLAPPPKEMLMDIHVNDTTRAFFYSMLPYFTQKVPPADDLLVLKFKELIFNLLVDPENTAFLSYVNSIDGEYKTPIWQIMEANYMYHLTIPQFANLASRSVSTFKRDFTDYYHTTPGKWLTVRRLEEAKLLLESSSKTVSEIALDVGFENLSHFSRIFREKYGKSPVQYRNQ